MTTTTDSPSTTERGALSFSGRDLMAIGFRHKRAIMLTFSAIFIGAILAAIFQPPKYQTSTKFLIQHDRMDPIVTPDQEARVIRTEVTEEEMSSEIELVQSEDVLHQVVLTTGLQNHKSLPQLSFLKSFPQLSFVKHDDEEERIARAIVGLRKSLDVEQLKKSNIIEVSYNSSDPKLAAAVLRALDDAYVQKNLAVHHAPGAFQFFDQETERYKKNLADAEARLTTFSQQEGGVSPQVARDITLQKLNEFTAALQQTNADMAGTKKRISELEQESSTTPQRLTTQSRAMDDAQVLQGLKTTLMNLELKRTELLTKYQPTYPLVQEVDKQIADTRNAIAGEESKPLREETTDQNPTYSWIGEELAKARADYSALQARAAAMKLIVEKYQAKAHELEEKNILQQDLLRDIKSQEDNYLVYQRKREEAQMTDALNRTRILNVVIAEQPSVPSLPSNSPLNTLLLGFVVAMTFSIGIACVLEYADSSLRTPSEVLAELNIPVMAAVPEHWSTGYGNGNRNGHGNRDSSNGRPPRAEATVDTRISDNSQSA
jgi:uncharacterized protein involved in exopolysaccharide biosynthesis